MNKTLGALLLFLVVFGLLAINFSILTKHNLRLEILEQNPNVPITEEEFIKTILTMKRKKTIIIVSHKDSVLKKCDRIIKL